MANIKFVSTASDFGCSSDNTVCSA